MRQAERGEHPFIEIDRSARVGTLEPGEHPPKVRLSPDVFRWWMPEEPPAGFVEPAADGPAPSLEGALLAHYLTRET
ncbi:MAG: hypothetical protein KC619_24110 [Myxococcales bacterium]|nr:hypothetical protein [Myxococcales bacterium]